MKNLFRFPFVALLSCLALSLAHAGDINRKTFALTIPKDWTEDTKDDMYNPDGFVFFENAESCLFTVIIAKKSAGGSVGLLLKAQNTEWEKKLKGRGDTISFDEWGGYKGKGLELQGKMMGVVTYKVRLFGFESKDNACVVVECSTPGDYKTFAKDFDAIRKSFKLR